MKNCKCEVSLAFFKVTKGIWLVRVVRNTPRSKAAIWAAASQQGRCLRTGTLARGAQAAHANGTQYCMGAKHMHAAQARARDVRTGPRTQARARRAARKCMALQAQLHA